MTLFSGRKTPFCLLKDKKGRNCWELFLISWPTDRFIKALFFAEILILWKLKYYVYYHLQFFRVELIRNLDEFFERLFQCQNVLFEWNLAWAEVYMLNEGFYAFLYLTPGVEIQTLHQELRLLTSHRTTSIMLWSHIT